MKKLLFLFLCFSVIAVGVFSLTPAFAEGKQITTTNLMPTNTSIIHQLELKDDDIVNPGVKPIEDGSLIDQIKPVEDEVIIPVTIKQVNLVYPRGGQVLKLGQPVIVEFTVKSPGDYKVFISADSGQTWSPLGGTVEADTKGFYPWIVDRAGKYCIKVQSASDDSIYDEGADFTVEPGKWDGQLQATAGRDSVVLSWKGVSCSPGKVSTYLVFRSITPKVTTETPLISVKLVDGAPVGGPVSFTDTNVEQGTTYHYIVAPQVDGQVVTGLYNQVSATPKAQGEIILTVGSPYMTVNGQTMEIEPGRKTVPVIVNGRVFVPIKAIVEVMGGVVTWDKIKRQVTIIYNDNIIILTVGSKEIIVNGVAKSMDVAPFISDTGSTMLPIRFVAEHLGCIIAWEADAGKIIINYNQ